MPNVEYTYSIANDFPGGSANTAKLQAEVAASPITTALAYIGTENDVLTIYFRASLSAPDKTILDGDTTRPAGGLIAAHDNTPSISYTATQIATANGTIVNIRTDTDGNLKVSPTLPDGSKFNVFSVNWCDKTTWFEKSVKITNETMTDSGNGLTFNASHDYWIDMTHGKMTSEDDLTAEGNYLVTVKSDGVTKTQFSPGTTNGDYQVDFAAGTVTFNSSQSGKAVTATYWHATTGAFTVKSLPGKKIKILYVEVQFSKDIVLNDTMIFQPFGYAGVFAPQYVPTPYAATDLVPLQAPNLYKSARDFVNESNGCYPLIPGFGGNNWRGLAAEVITLPWRYLTRTELFSSYGMEIRVSMESNTPHTGELGTVTFYCVSEDE